MDDSKDSFIKEKFSVLLAKAQMSRKLKASGEKEVDIFKWNIDKNVA